MNYDNYNIYDKMIRKFKPVSPRFRSTRKKRLPLVEKVHLYMFIASTKQEKQYAREMIIKNDEICYIPPEKDFEGEGYSSFKLRKILDDIDSYKYIVVVFTDESMAGFLLIEQYDNELIIALLCSKDGYGLGVFRMFYDWVVEYTDINNISLYPSNQYVEAAYKRWGFESLGEVQNFKVKNRLISKKSKAVWFEKEIELK